MAEEIKLIQYVIVPKRPKMSKGKIASQVAHATFRALDKQREKTTERDEELQHSIIGGPNEFDNIEEWKKTGMCVIVLKCNTTTELLAIGQYLKDEQLIYHVVVDEGLTEIPMGTATALATGVLPESEHWRFKTMRLFR